MATVTAGGRQVIQLDSRNEGGTVTVTPRDGDRYNLKVGEVIHACQQVKADEQARERFEFMLKRLALWIMERDDIRDAFLTTRDGGLCFLAVHSTPAYDAAFEDALSDLDIELANDQDIRFPIKVMSLPPVSEKSMQSFLSTEFTLQFASGKHA
jgi:hypothetical protein